MYRNLENTHEKITCTANWLAAFDTCQWVDKIGHTEVVNVSVSLSYHLVSSLMAVLNLGHIY